MFADILKQTIKRIPSVPVSKQSTLRSKCYKILEHMRCRQMAPSLRFPAQRLLSAGGRSSDTLHQVQEIKRKAWRPSVTLRPVPIEDQPDQNQHLFPRLCRSRLNSENIFLFSVLAKLNSLAFSIQRSFGIF